MGITERYGLKMKARCAIEENSSGKVGHSREKCASVCSGATRKLPEGGAILPRSDREVLLQQHANFRLFLDRSPPEAFFFSTSKLVHIREVIW